MAVSNNDRYPGDRQPDIGLIALSDLFQFKIITEVFDLLFQRHVSFITFIQHVFHQLGELQYHIRSLIGLFYSQRIQVVQRIEQKVRIDLRTKVVDFRL